MEDVHEISFTVGAQAGTIVRPIYHVPAGHGGITILNAWVLSAAAATSILTLTNQGTSLGTAVVSTIGTLNGTLVANVQQAIAITTAYQAANTWVAFRTAAGDAALNAATLVVLEFKYGK